MKKQNNTQHATTKLTVAAAAFAGTAATYKGILLTCDASEKLGAANRRDIYQ